MSTLDLATGPDGALALGPDGDLASLEGDAATRARLLRAFLTQPGTIPYFPGTGAGAPAHEGGPPVGGDDLARAVLTEARADEDVLEASAARVTTRIVEGVQVTTVSCAVRTRATPDAVQTLTQRLPS